MTEVYGDDFDWDSASVVVHEQRAIAVYWNDNSGGAVVVREKGGDYEPDHYARIPRDAALKVVRAILAEAGIEVAMARVEDGGLDEPLLLPKPEPLTNAERQRLYRQRHRNESNETAELPLRLSGAQHHQEELAS